MQKCTQTKNNNWIFLPPPHKKMDCDHPLWGHAMSKVMDSMFIYKNNKSNAIF